MSKENELHFETVDVRFYPNKTQKPMLTEHFNAKKWAYNFSLDVKKRYYNFDETKMNQGKLSALLPIMKENEPWLKAVDSTLLQQAIKDMMKAYDKFFKEGTGYPNFKNRYAKKSYRTTQAKIKSKHILHLPKIGKVKMKGFREFIEPIDENGNGGEALRLYSCTVKERAGQYYASLTFVHKSSYVIPKLKKETNRIVGIDMGLTDFAVLSNGVTYEGISNTLKKHINRLKVIQQKLSKKKKGSNNYNKLKLKLSRAYKKITDIRDDIIHKITNTITKENQIVVVEDLNIKKMTEKASSLAPSNKNYSRMILQEAWGFFFRLLEYKTKRNSHQLIKVNPAYTSQKCSCCGHISKDNRNKKNFKCKKCNLALDADLNASYNIRDLGEVALTLL